MDQKGYLNLVPFIQSQKPKYMQILTGLLEPAMDLQGAVGSEEYVYDLDNAAGDQLDTLGEYVGISRVLPFSLDQEQPELTIIRKTRSSSDISQWGSQTLTYKLMEIDIDIIDSTPAYGDYLAITFTEDIIPTKNVKYSILYWLDTSDGDTISQESKRAQIYDMPGIAAGQTAFVGGRTYYFEYVNDGYNDGYMLLDYNPEDIQVAVDTRQMNDEEYRMMIKLRIARNWWDGSNESAEEIYRTILGDSIRMRQKDNQDCTVDIEIDGTSTQRLTQILDGTDNLLIPAGVYKHISEIEDDISFTLLLGSQVVGIQIYDEVIMLEG